jgi:hypothetical protein
VEIGEPSAPEKRNFRATTTPIMHRPLLVIPPRNTYFRDTMKDRSSFNPYVVLGVDQKASDEEIQQALRRRLADDPDGSVRIQHAYRILKKPELRKQLDEKLDARIWDFLEDGPPAEKPPEPKKRRRSFFGFSLPKS